MPCGRVWGRAARPRGQAPQRQCRVSPSGRRGVWALSGDQGGGGGGVQAPRCGEGGARPRWSFDRTQPSPPSTPARGRQGKSAWRGVAGLAAQSRWGGLGGAPPPSPSSLLPLSGSCGAPSLFFPSRVDECPRGHTVGVGKKKRGRQKKRACLPACQPTMWSQRGWAPRGDDDVDPRAATRWVCAPAAGTRTVKGAGPAGWGAGPPAGGEGGRGILQGRPNGGCTRGGPCRRENQPPSVTPPRGRRARGPSCPHSPRSSVMDSLRAPLYSHCPGRMGRGGEPRPLPPPACGSISPSACWGLGGAPAVLCAFFFLFRSLFLQRPQNGRAAAVVVVEAVMGVVVVEAVMGVVVVDWLVVPPPSEGEREGKGASR